MKKLLLLSTLFLCAYSSRSQKAIASLQKMNTIYIGVSNPVDFALEGYKMDQLTIHVVDQPSNEAQRCVLDKDSIKNQFFLRPLTPGVCKVAVSYNHGSETRVDTLKFKMKNLPPPEAFFGDLESGTYSMDVLMKQNILKAIRPQFEMEWESIKVMSYSVAFVPRRGEACFYNLTYNKIPLELKKGIISSKKGDKIIVDEIMMKEGGKKKRLSPVVITLHSNSPEINDHPDYLTYQNHEDSAIGPYNNQLFQCDASYSFPPGILRGHKVFDCQDKMILEVKKNSKKILSEKHFYPSGKLKSEYNFENNDTLGDAISYYEDGKIKSKGKVLIKSDHIFPYYRRDINCGVHGTFVMCEQAAYLDSFFYLDYAPYGHWLGYSKTGEVILDCQFRVYDYGKIPMGDNDLEFNISVRNKNKKTCTVKDALATRNNYFRVIMDGNKDMYDRAGRKISADYF